MNLGTIQQDIASLPPDAQLIIVELVEVLKPTFRTRNCHTPKKPIYLVHKN
ncbi:MAG: hypothetical protein MET45_30570 [Nostoc sp. LLA-1]|nr:hypothetical protein [Cyanocohniella sp. LLY]